MAKKPRTALSSSKQNSLVPSGFSEAISLLKEKIQESRLNAAISVNQNLMKLYWEIGRIIVENQKAQKWGMKVLENLGNELQKSFPGVAGFSRANLFKMKAFYLAYEKVSQPVRQFDVLPVSRIPWGHNVLLITKIKEEKERLWYANMVIEEGWSRRALEDAIASKYFHRNGKAIRNFKDRLPQPQSELAQEMLKDPYDFGFLELADGYKERELEQGLISHIQLDHVGKISAQVAKAIALVGVYKFRLQGVL